LTVQKWTAPDSADLPGHSSNLRNVFSPILGRPHRSNPNIASRFGWVINFPKEGTPWPVSEKRGNKWKYRIRYNDLITGKRVETMKSGFKTKKEAQVEAGVIEERIYRGQTTVVKNQKMLVKD
jgi:hypothetical protein